MIARTREAIWHAVVVPMLVGLFACSSADGADKPPPPPEKPAELKIMEKWVGEWESTNTTTVLNGEPADITIKGPRTRKWGLGGWFIVETGKNDDGSEVHVMFTFDQNARQFKMWYFDSRGTAADSLGTWNEATRTLSWSKDHGNGITQAGWSRFVDDNTQEWKSSVKDASGKVLWEGGGKLTRKK
jgi:hypothetical protein